MDANPCWSFQARVVHFYCQFLCVKYKIKSFISSPINEVFDPSKMFTFFSAEFITLNDCLQLAYLPSKRNHMLLLYPREILILDLEVNQTVGVIAIERTGVPFLQVSTIHKLYYPKLLRVLY